MANLKCHMPIMVSVAVYAMRIATGPELSRGLSFGVGVGGSYLKGQGKKIRVGNIAFLQVSWWQS